MTIFIELISFFGGWLLFAGPIYQAALELMEEDVERDRIRLTRQNIQPPKRISPLWWLLPPIKIYLEQRRSRIYRNMYMKALLPEDAAALVSFTNKATGWLLVALGGLLLAIRETYAIAESYKINIILFWEIAITSALLSVAYTAFRLTNTKDVSSKE